MVPSASRPTWPDTKIRSPCSRTWLSGTTAASGEFNACSLTLPVDRLPFQEEPEPFLALLREVPTGPAEASERHMRIQPGRRAIDRDDACADAVEHPADRVRVAPVDGGAQAHAAGAGDPDVVVGGLGPDQHC